MMFGAAALSSASLQPFTGDEPAFGMMMRRKPACSAACIEAEGPPAATAAAAHNAQVAGQAKEDLQHAGILTRVQLWGTTSCVPEVGAGTEGMHNTEVHKSTREHHVPHPVASRTN